MNYDKILEEFSNAQHEIWAHWMKYLFTKGCDMEDGSFRINSKQADRWKKQMNTSYIDLTEEEKQSDKDVVTEHMKKAIASLVEIVITANINDIEEEFVLIEKEGWKEMQESLEDLVEKNEGT